MSDCCPTVTEPTLTWPASWSTAAFNPTPAFPADWTASVFGQYDLRRACGCAFVHDVLIAGTRKDVYPPPPIWRTQGDFYESHIDVVIGNRQPDSPAWLTAAWLRDRALQPGRSGVVAGVVPLSWLASTAIPGDFTAKEISAQAAAEEAFTTGVTLEQIQDAHHLSGTDRYWGTTLSWSPLANLPSWQQPRSTENVPRRVVATLTAAGVLAVDRESLTIVAAARAQALHELALFIVYI